MKYRLIIFLLLMTTAGVLQAQWEHGGVRLEAVASGGATATSVGGGFFSHTLGQTAFMHSAHVNEGVQQFIGSLETIVVALSICEGDTAALLAEMPQGYSLPSEVDLQHEGNYVFRLDLISQHGGDSIVYYEIDIHPVYDTTIVVQATDSYTWLGQEYTRSGSHTALLHTAKGCDSTVRMTMSILTHNPIPAIYNYLDRVVMVDHNPEGYSNVDYGYYRWYRNDTLVAEGSNQDFYQPEESMLRGCYRLEVPTDATRNYWVSSNTVCLDSSHSGGEIALPEIDRAVNITLWPNPVKHGNSINIGVDANADELEKMELYIYNAVGYLHEKVPAQKNIVISVDYPKGIYSVAIRSKEGEKVVRKFIVF
ncbi:MAG: T9SS type A sorting domain-containing protein [Bacteroidales bacterium]|nr:T9SS type A sorting domain-containing protein [Bacteroidales bacterium]